jgi:hypothetical protein
VFYGRVGAGRDVEDLVGVEGLVRELEIGEEEGGAGGTGQRGEYAWAGDW